MHKHRVVCIDNHIVLQFSELDKWWTCSKANIGDESDFAIWPESPANIQKAYALIGCEVPIVSTDRMPCEHADGWYTDSEDRKPKSHREAIRELARLV